MQDDISDIEAFYSGAVAAEDARLAEHQLEYDLTWRYLVHYLPARGSVLEIGAATGHYTLELARRGHAVTAVDLSPALLAAARERIAAAGLEHAVRFAVADARTLDAVPGTAYDAVLLMGPLYHLVHAADRAQALRQAVDRLRPGGIICSAFLSRLGILGDLLQRNPAWIDRTEEVRWLIEHGRRPDDQPKGGFRGYLARVEEIAPLHEAHGIETLALAGVEPAISAGDENFNRLYGTQRERWLDLLYSVSTEATTVGASRHLLYVGRKPNPPPPHSETHDP